MKLPAASSGSSGRLPPQHDRRAFRLADLDVLVDPVALALVDEGAELRLPPRRHSDPDPAGLVREALHELVVDGALDEDPRAGRADLSLREVDAEHRADDRLVEVGVGEDDRRRLAAELERHALDRARARAHDRAARDGRAGERELVDVGVLGERGAGELAEARDHVEDARRSSGLQADPAQLEARERCELGRLEDDGVPRRQRRRPLAAGDMEREVPRDDHADHAHRLLAHVVERRLREREHAAVDRPDEPLVEAPRVPAGRKVDERRLADRLADVVALDLCEVFLLGLDQLGDAEQDPGALVRIEVAPGREGSPRRAHRPVDVLGLGGGDLHDRPVRGRVDRRHRLAARPRPPTRRRSAASTAELRVVRAAPRRVVPSSAHSVTHP